MESRTRRDEESDREGADAPPVMAHESRPGRTVFTESGNADGWIATDLTVDPRP